MKLSSRSNTKQGHRSSTRPIQNENTPTEPAGQQPHQPSQHIATTGASTPTNHPFPPIPAAGPVTEAGVMNDLRDVCWPGQGPVVAVHPSRWQLLSLWRGQRPPPQREVGGPTRRRRTRRQPLIHIEGALLDMR